MAGFFKWIFFFSIQILCVSAQSQKIFFEQLTTAEGLPSDYVNCVFRDSKGFLWIGSDKGASRYDGVDFLHFNKDNGLPSNFVYCIAEDTDGNIWLGTFEGGLCKFDGEQINPFEYNNPDFINIRLIHFNADKSFFVGTHDNLYYFSSEKAIPEKLRDFKPFFSPVNADLFITGNDREIYFLEKKEHSLLFRPSSRHDFFSVYNGQFLLLEKHAISSFSTDGNRFLFQHRFSLEKNSLPANRTDIKQCFINGDELLIATVNGLIYTDERNNEFFFNSKNGLGADYVRSIYKDRQGNIYICTFGGGIRIWPKLYLQEFATDGKVTSIFPAGNCTYISSGKSIYKHIPSSNKFLSLASLEGGNFTAVYKTEKGKFYLGTLNSFFSFPEENELKNLNERTKKSYGNFVNTGVSGFLSLNNRLYISTYGDGIIELEDGKNNAGSNKMSGAGIGNIIEFLVSVKNSFAALTYNSGLTIVQKDGAGKNISTKEKLLSNTVYSLFSAGENEIWIGTYKGLNLFDGKTVVKSYSYDDGLTGSKVICIFRDKKQRLWVLSDRFLHLFGEEKLRAIRSHPLLFGEHAVINRAAYDQQNDILYIGLNNALLTLDMQKVVPDTSIRYPVLSKVLSGDTAIPLHDKIIVMPHRSGKIVFNFAHQFHSLSHKTDLYYKLSGFDEEWRLSTGNAAASYLKLPAGDYELVAKTTNPDGYTSPEMSLLNLQVLPPLWKRTWFIAMLALVLLAVFFFIGHIISKKRYKQKLRYIQEEFRLQLERERIARELHDNVGSQLTYLINKIEDDYPLLSNQDQALQLSNFARNTMRELRETIWVLDKKEVMPDEMESKLKQLIRMYNNKNRVAELAWHTDALVNPLNSTDALNIFRIVQEALNNADKYSDAARIVVSVKRENNQLYFTINDNGKGFNFAEAKNGYGIQNMYRRAKEIGANLELISDSGKGTTVILTR